jgi:hypothetical protein
VLRPASANNDGFYSIFSERLSPRISPSTSPAAQQLPIDTQSGATTQKRKCREWRHPIVPVDCARLTRGCVKRHTRQYGGDRRQNSSELRGLLGDAADDAPAWAEDERLRIKRVSVAGLSVHAATEVLNKRARNPETVSDSGRPTTAARLWSRLSITDGSGLLRGRRIAAVNDRPRLVTGRLIDFICHVAIELRAGTLRLL